MEVQGRIKLVGQTQQVNASFNKRELVLTTDADGNYPQHIMIEFNQDKCGILDKFQVGQEVKVSINLRGREWQSPQGETKFFNTIQGWKIEAVGQQQQAPQQKFQQNNQQGNFQQQQQFQQNNNFQGGNANQDLPF